MSLHEFLSPEAVLPALRVSGKKQALHDLASHASRLTGLDERAVFETLWQRERLVGLLARLERPIDFEALDGQPVDIIFLLLAPEGAGADHLKALARVARVLREQRTIERIRATRDADALYAVITQTSAPRAA